MVNSLFSCVDFFEGEEDIIISYGDIIFTKENLKKVLSCKKDISLMIDINYLEYWKVRSQYPLNDFQIQCKKQNANYEALSKGAT